MFNEKNTADLFNISKIKADKNYATNFSAALNDFAKTLPVLDGIKADCPSEPLDGINFEALRADVVNPHNCSDVISNSKNRDDKGIFVSSIINS